MDGGPSDADEAASLALARQLAGATPPDEAVSLALARRLQAEEGDPDEAASLALARQLAGATPPDEAASLALAQQLSAPGPAPAAAADGKLDLTSPEAEVLDPNPDVFALFQHFDRLFFDGRLQSCEVRWSRRMTLCAGICSFHPNTGFCSIALSEPLLKLRPRKDLVETLLHEMIHGFLFVTGGLTDRDGHGPQFQAHMHRINAQANTNITIYHDFVDEVGEYRKHVWRCSGSCRSGKYGGYVRRASNRAPGPNDPWWNRHKAHCSGAFVKESEPEEFTRKNEEKRKRKEARELKKEEKQRAAEVKRRKTEAQAQSLRAAFTSSSSPSPAPAPAAPAPALAAPAPALAAPAPALAAPAPDAKPVQQCPHCHRWLPAKSCAAHERWCAPRQ